jgi:hypothetical protein
MVGEIPSTNRRFLPICSNRQLRFGFPTETPYAIMHRATEIICLTNADVLYFSAKGKQ